MSDYKLVDAYNKVQRLRAALEEVHEELKTLHFMINQDDDIFHERKKKYLSIIEYVGQSVAGQALSTTEPTGPSISKTQIENIKKLLNDPSYHGMYRSGIFDVLEELGITIPGINATEKEADHANS